MKTLKVTGTGGASAEADRVTISFEVSAQAVEYDACLRELNSRAANLRATLRRMDIPDDAVKTKDFSVTVEDEYKDGRRRFVGFKAEHTLSIRIPMDKDRLNAVLRDVAHGHSQAEITLTFSVKDQEGLREAAIRQAVANGRRCAGILAEAAGSTLGELQRIDYSWGEMHIYERQSTMVCENIREAGEHDVDLNPESIAADASVTLEFELK